MSTVTKTIIIAVIFIAGMIGGWVSGARPLAEAAVVRPASARPVNIAAVEVKGSVKVYVLWGDGSVTTPLLIMSK